MTLRIVTDSTCDLPQSLIERYGITVIPLYIHIGNQSYRDQIDITREQFRERLVRFAEGGDNRVTGPIQLSFNNALVRSDVDTLYLDGDVTPVQGALVFDGDGQTVVNGDIEIETQPAFNWFGKAFAK